MRIERDSMGEMEVPDEALWGAQTQRAVRNFPISDLRFPRSFIRALALIKRSAAEVNEELGGVAPEMATAVKAAAQEAMNGELDDHFVLDIFQTGSGTSTNMNANEVIANRATQILGGEVGSRMVQRCDTDGDTSCRRARHRHRARARIGAPATGARRQIGGLLGRHQDGPHASAGCDTHPAWTGVSGPCGANGTSGAQTAPRRR